MAVDLAPAPNSALPREPKGWTYLPGLDGLRAIAVLSVMIFHAGASWLPGGFLGVDVFFVLSGFLITSLVLAELHSTDKLDFKRFYLRRARRLLPAVLLLLAVVSVAAAFWVPDAAAGVRRDVPAALLYLSNWAFIANDLSYFEAMGRPPLLQHLWSLAIEEQFYLIWPLLAFVAYRVAGVRAVRILALTGAIAATLWMGHIATAGGFPSPNDPSRVYFGTDTHSMGLLIGAALATVWRPGLASDTPRVAVRRLVNAVAVASFIGIGWTMHVASETTEALYRGGFLAFAVLTGIFIVGLTHPASLLGRYLGSQPWRYIGQRSYGLYLWHWPVFLVLRPGIDIPITGWPAIALMFAVTFGIAELSYRYLEMPIRRGALGRWLKALRDRERPDHSRVARVILAGSLALVVAVVVVGQRLERATANPVIPDYLDGALAVSTVAPAAAAPTRSPDPIPPEATATPVGRAWTPGITAVGESVMLGVRDDVAAALPGLGMDAAVSRQAADIVTVVRNLKTGRFLAPTVVIQLGTNGIVTEAEMTELMALLADRERVVLVTPHAERAWEEPNLQLLRAQASVPNVRIADWHSLAAGNPGFTVSDGVHATDLGGAAYAALIVSTLAEFGQQQPLLVINADAKQRLR